MRLQLHRWQVYCTPSYPRGTRSMTLLAQLASHLAPCSATSTIQYLQQGQAIDFLSMFAEQPSPFTKLDGDAQSLPNLCHVWVENELLPNGIIYKQKTKVSQTQGKNQKRQPPPRMSPDQKGSSVAIGWPNG
ncbi:unnamed protein product [Prunus armeniaca]